MKNARVFALVLALCLILTALCPAVLADSAPEINARNAIVIDMNTGTVLYEKDADNRVPPASTTKIMTLLLVCEAVERGDVKLSDVVTAQKADLELHDDDASTVKIKAGEKLSLRDLCYCAMLVSANDACNVVAAHTAGSVEAFVNLMNEKAAELGCENTHFVNTNGLPSNEHFTTARELAVITQEALKHDLFRELCGTAEYTVPKTDSYKERHLSNSNALINSEAFYGDQYVYEGAYGVKTGHTEAAGYCLVSAAKAGDLDLLAVVLGADGDSVTGKYFHDFDDTINLLDYSKNNWSTTCILSTDEELGQIPVEKGVEDFAALSPASDISKLLPNDYDLDSLERTVTLKTESLTAPVKQGTVLGSVSISNTDGEVVCTCDLVAADNIRMSLITYAFDNAKEFVGDNLTGIGITLLVIIFTVFMVVYLPNKLKGKKKK